MLQAFREREAAPACSPMCGYGGGYFDRYISGLLGSGVSPRLLGVAYGVNEVDESLFEPHDLPLDLIITDIGIF